MVVRANNSLVYVVLRTNNSLVCGTLRTNNSLLSGHQRLIIHSYVVLRDQQFTLLWSSGPIIQCYVFLRTNNSLFHVVTQDQYFTLT